MNITISPQLPIKCNQCGSKLIVVKKKQEKSSITNFSKIVITTYKCSKPSCPSHNDIKVAKEAIKAHKLNKDKKQNIRYRRH